jgi:hypothetical protein
MMGAGKNIWKSDSKGQFKIQRKADKTFVVADKRGRALRLKEEEVFDLTDFLDDFCDRLSDGKITFL